MPAAYQSSIRLTGYGQSSRLVLIGLSLATLAITAFWFSAQARVWLTNVSPNSCLTLANGKIGIASTVIHGYNGDARPEKPNAPKVARWDERKTHMRSALLSLILLMLAAKIFAGQQLSKTDDELITLPSSLSRVLTDYENRWKAGDAAGLALLFTEDGFVLAPGQPPVRGRAAIRKLYTGPGSPLSLRAFAYAVNGNFGYILGGYSSSPGTPDEGKFTLILRKRNGRWLIVSDMDNENRRH